MRTVQKTLKRQTFTVSRELEYFSEAELTTQTGYARERWWPDVVTKELVDNALDASEQSGTAPAIVIDLERHRLEVRDNGPGIQPAVVKRILDYSTRTGDKQAYVSPTRGAQGNALARYPDSGVVFFSLEMPRLQAFERQLQIHAGKKRDEVIWAYRRGDRSAVNAEEFLARCKDRLAIIDTPGISLPEIQRRVSAMQALKRVKPVRLVVIDYLGYLGGGSRDALLVERTSEIARGVKRLAKDLGTVVFLIAQTSRHARDGSEEVTITDARDSGAIEDSADFLIGCWRPELKAGLSPEAFMDVEGRLWFRILKARRGMQARFQARFEGETLRVLEPVSERVTVP
jgi:replicative DNA helicase